MSDFLLELLSEEIPARMQAKARADLSRLFEAELAKSGLAATGIETYATPRRLALIARGLPLGTPAQAEELKGPRTSAPPQALEGFLRKTGLNQDQLTDRDGIWFAVLEKPGRATTEVLAEAIPAIVRAFPWPKSMRWGAASLSTESLRWVRPLQGIVAMLDEEVVDMEIGDVRSGAATIGHRFHHPGPITLAGAKDYAEKLRACHVIIDQDERARLIRDGAAAAASAAGLTMVADEGLVEENAGLTEWPQPLLGRFDPAFLEVPREVIQLTMRTNQKYFACVGADGALAPAFICVANIAAADGGARIVEGNQKVLAARLSDARFFWEQDLKIPLEDQAAKLGQIVFHEKLGTVADKVERVAKLARWLVEEGIVGSTPTRRATPSVIPAKAGISFSSGDGAKGSEIPASAGMTDSGSIPGRASNLADLAERAARLCKADLVTQMVGEFPELQGLIGGYLAEAQGEDPQVAAAIRDHYKPVGQGDEVPTDPVTVAVSLADKLDSLLSFYGVREFPSGSRDPFALRRAALGTISLIVANDLRFPLVTAFDRQVRAVLESYPRLHHAIMRARGPVRMAWAGTEGEEEWFDTYVMEPDEDHDPEEMDWREAKSSPEWLVVLRREDDDAEIMIEDEAIGLSRFWTSPADQLNTKLLDFFADRLKVQQREAGVRHDLIDAVFALGGEDDLVRLLARVRALQAFVETSEGKDLLAGYKRAANILKKEAWPPQNRHPGLDPGSAFSSGGDEGRRMPLSGENVPRTFSAMSGGHGDLINQVRHDEGKLSYSPEPAENALIAALDSAEPEAAAAVEREDFEGAMRALATLRGPVDAFFNEVIVNDPIPEKREARLNLLARIRGAVHRVADFSRIEG